MNQQFSVLVKSKDHAFMACSLALIFGVVLVAGCNNGSRDVAPDSKQPIITKLNEKYQIAVEFYGEFLGADSEPTQHILVKEILIRDIGDGRLEQFVPYDPITLENSFGYFTDVWSPDNAYLAFPLGRFQGFVLISSRTVMEDLHEGRFAESVQIRLPSKNSPMLWHEFSGWEEPHTFRFSAGLSGSLVEFTFDPETGVVRGQVATNRSFLATTKSGTTEILNDFR